MRTIRQSGVYELEERKSRFVCSLGRVTTEEEAREFIRQCRREYHDARHHCSAYVLGDDGQAQKSSDDGEPAGTAGVPMLEVLRRNELTNAVAVVSRHFGGVLLGAGGLIRAYSGAVAQALDHVGLAERRELRIVSVTVDHGGAGKLENELRASGHEIADVHYTDRVRFDLHVTDGQVESLRAWLAEATGGSVELTLGGTTHAEFPV